MDEQWQFPPTFKFEMHDLVNTNGNWVGQPLVNLAIINRGQRTAKNKKGESIFDSNSYQVVDKEGKVHYFLENELQ